MPNDNESIETSDFNVDEIASEIIGNDSTPSQSSDDESEGKLETDPNQAESDENASPENILKLVAKEKDENGDGTELLSKINSLGLIRNGLPIAIESPDQLKEIIQKGFDYTQKTMEHAEVVKAKDAEFVTRDSQLKESEAAFTQRTQQFESVLENNDIIADMMSDMKVNDPELFEHLDAMMIKRQVAQQAQNRYRDQFKGEFNQLRGEIDGLKSEKQSHELSNIKQGWEKELGETQTNFAASLSKLGVKPDWTKVKDAWAADTTNKMTVEQAMYAVHGKDIQKANESYQKLLATKNKTQSKLLNRTGVGGGSKTGNTSFKGQLGNFDQLIDQVISNEQFI